MRELSLFTGAGGGLLGTKLLGMEPCGYVEFNDYCQRVIAARIADGYLPAAPIFGDIRAFVSEGYAASYTGLVDVVSAGFPCQPFSVAGKQAAENDERNMWPATRDVIRIVRPRSVLLENVSGLLSTGYVWTIFADLAALGYVGRWGVLGASDCGAPHKRERLWVVAHTQKQPSYGRSDYAGIGVGGKSFPQFGNGDRTESISHANRARQETKRHVSRVGWKLEPTSYWSAGTSESPCESVVGRMADGMAVRMDRLKAIGNGQVPFCVEAAWRILS